MILEGIISAALWLITGIFDVLFTSVDLVTGGNGSVSGGIIVGYAWLNTFLPVAEVVGGIIFLLSLYVFLFGYRLVREAWTLVPVIGGKS